MQHQSIINFLNHCLHPQFALHSLANLADGTLFLKILSTVEGIQLNKAYIIDTPETELLKLGNLRYLLLKIKQFLRSSSAGAEEEIEIDLMEIVRTQNSSQIVKLFQRLLKVMVNAPNKNEFIQRIIRLEEEQKEFFKDEIMKCLNPQIQHDPVMPHKESEEEVLLMKLSELEEEAAASKQQNLILEQLHKELRLELQQYKTENRQLTENIKALQREVLRLRQQEQQQISKDLTNSRRIITGLQKKRLEENAEYEKKCQRLSEEILQLESTIVKGQRTQRMLVDSQTRIRQLSEKSCNLKEENDYLIKKIQQQQFTIKALEEKVKVLNENIVKIQTQKISLKAANAKSNARSAELQRMLSISFEQKKPSQRVATQTLDRLEDPLQAKYCQAKQQLSIANRRVKELQKQMAKSNLKLQRLEKVEDEKKKLETVLIEFTNSRCQEVEILLSALYQLRIRYQSLVKKQSIQDSTFISTETE